MRQKSAGSSATAELFSNFNHIAMTQASLSPLSFFYRAHTSGGEAISGSIDAASAQQAQQLLEALRLHVLDIEAREPAPLVQSEPTMSVAQSLRLVAQMALRRKQSSALNEVAMEFERGAPLSLTLEALRGHLGSLYSRLIAADLGEEKLPGTLIDL